MKGSGGKFEFSAYLLKIMKSHASSYIVVFCINQVRSCKLSN